MLTAEQNSALSWNESYFLQVEAAELVVWLLVLIVTYVGRLRREAQCVKVGLR